MTKIKFNSSNLLQPILTVVLIGLLIFLAMRLSKTENPTKDTSLTQVEQRLSLDEAIKNYQSESHEVYVRGTLFVTNTANPNTTTPKTTTTPTPTGQLKVTQNDFNYFFYVENNKVTKLDYKNLGKNETLFVDPQGNLVFIDNVTESYTKYDVPADSETELVNFFKGTQEVMQQSFPLIPLLEDYKNKKFNPVEVTQNLYQGKWQHPIFTSNEIVEVILQTDPNNGLFRKMRINHGFIETSSELAFDFRSYPSEESIYVIPQGYKEVKLNKEYKTKY